MNNQPIKRKNPFDNFVQPEEEEIVVEKEVIVEDVEEVFYQKPQPVQKNPRVVQRNYYQPVAEEKKEKYTSTMEVELRRRIKITCAMRGIMFAQFVEEACREKLQREGVK